MRMNPSALITPAIKEEIALFAQNLVRIKSYSGQEAEAVKLIESQMKKVCYDEVTLDSMGKVLGR